MFTLELADRSSVQITRCKHASSSHLVRWRRDRGAACGSRRSACRCRQPLQPRHSPTRISLHPLSLSPSVSRTMPRLFAAVVNVSGRVVASTQSFKYQYKYQYLSLKYQYQYKYPVLQPWSRVPAYPGSPGQKAVKRLCVCH